MKSSTHLLSIHPPLSPSTSPHLLHLPSSPPPLIPSSPPPLPPSPPPLPSHYPPPSLASHLILHAFSYPLYSDIATFPYCYLPIDTALILMFTLGTPYSGPQPMETDDFGRMDTSGHPPAGGTGFEDEPPLLEGMCLCVYVLSPSTHTISLLHALELGINFQVIKQKVSLSGRVGAGDKVKGCGSCSVHCMEHSCVCTSHCCSRPFPASASDHFCP